MSAKKMTKKEAGYWSGFRKLIEAGDDSVEICKRSVAVAAGQSRGPLSTNKLYEDLSNAIEAAEADRLERIQRKTDPRGPERQLERQLQRAVSLCAHYELENQKLSGMVARELNRGERSRANREREEEAAAQMSASAP